MTDKSSSRFLQRLDSYSKAYSKFEQLVSMLETSSPSRLFTNDETGLKDEIVREALIKRFEFTQELSWNMLKDYLVYQGYTDIAGSRDAYRKALQIGVINDAAWMDMIADRNLSAHNYNEMKSKEISDRIISIYYPLLKELHDSMVARAAEISGDEF